MFVIFCYCNEMKCTHLCHSTRLAYRKAGEAISRRLFMKFLPMLTFHVRLECFSLFLSS